MLRDWKYCRPHRLMLPLLGFGVPYICGTFCRFVTARLFASCSLSTWIKFVVPKCSLSFIDVYPFIFPLEVSITLSFNFPMSVPGWIGEYFICYCLVPMVMYVSDNHCWMSCIQCLLLAHFKPCDRSNSTKGRTLYNDLCLNTFT